MATFHGKEGTVEFDSKVVGEVRSFSVEQTASTADDTVMGDDWETHLITRKAWSGSVECYLDSTATTGNANVVTVGSSAVLELFTQGSGSYNLSGTATVTSVSISESHDAVIEISFSFTGNGALTAAAI